MSKFCRVNSGSFCYWLPYHCFSHVMAVVLAPIVNGMMVLHTLNPCCGWITEQCDICILDDLRIYASVGSYTVKLLALSYSYFRQYVVPRLWTTQQRTPAEPPMWFRHLPMWCRQLICNNMPPWKLKSEHWAATYVTEQTVHEKIHRAKRGIIKVAF